MIPGKRWSSETLVSPTYKTRGAVYPSTRSGCQMPSWMKRYTVQKKKKDKKNRSNVDEDGECMGRGAGGRLLLWGGVSSDYIIMIPAT